MAALRLMRRIVTVTLLLGAGTRAAGAQDPGHPLQLADRGPRFYYHPAGATESIDARGAAVLKTNVALDLVNTTVADALMAIGRAAGVRIVARAELLPQETRVSVQADRITLAAALTDVLEDIPVDVELTSSSLLTVVGRKPLPVVPTDTIGSTLVVAQVTDTSGDRAFKGALITISGTKIHAKTDESGVVRIHNVPGGVRIITARFLGYTPREQRITVPDTGGIVIMFRLHMGMARLQQVVTTATGPQQRYEIANDVSILDADSIVRTQPINTVTDLLETRVTGLTVQHTSGAPGDPSRLRLRGAASILKTNDPIVVVDGVRLFSQPSDSLSANLASGRNSGGGIVGGSAFYAVPSPLDQIDPNIIETIEVLKGPSAATLYGPDAANGVIVISTKRGHAGAPMWNVSADHGTSYIPGQYPDGLYRWGHMYGGATVLCPITQFNCQADSLVRFQALDNPKYSVLTHGGRTNLSLGVAGGSDAVTYSLTGSADNEDGMLKLPAIEATRFGQEHQGAAPLGWMRHPQHLSRWSAAGRLTAKLGEHTDLSFTSTFTRELQQRSDLERDLSLLLSTYIDPKTNTYWRASGTQFSTVPELLPDFYQRATDDSKNSLNAVSLNWRPAPWLSTSADAGVNVYSRNDEVLLPPNMLPFSDSAGTLTIGRGESMQNTVNVRASGTIPLPLGVRLQLSTGANYVKTNSQTLTTGVQGLAPGTTGVDGAQHITFSTQSQDDITSFGWYIEPAFTVGHFTISSGLRFDASSSFGQNAKLPIFPKVGGSWVISEEPFFPFKKLFDVMRLRTAYGEAGVWPGPTDKLRLYTSQNVIQDSTPQNVQQVYSLGNAALRPERSAEIEAGLDADLFRDRLSVSLSGYRKMRYDAIMSVPVPPSVYGANVSRNENIGVIRNTGVEAAVTAQIIRSDPVSWSVTGTISNNHNLVTKLARGVLPFGPADARVVAGYPLFGRWARPILGYSDANHDGVIEPSEVLLGDTLVYMGSSEPNYESSFFTTLSLFKGAITVSASFDYQNGETQENSTLGGPGNYVFTPGTMDPHAPFGEQAAAAVQNLTDYGLLQTVSTLRFNSLSVAYNFSPSVAHWAFRARALSIALQGTNLGLWTSYKGKDPNVNAFATGNAVQDTGVLPIPRYWLVSVHATY
ncbi:MAG TPA: TonB-dependent receptor plug domain-containing protein [Gemmatimonadaceae bacterium]|nr:TonB-dependent receptor plug domain-containing protein [Gemmatimonadaceae bacterium]